VAVRVVDIDDWSWRKGTTSGTIMVDLARREVVDILHDRSADSIAGWLGGRLAVELVSRDRCGLYAHGAARGAPQARQVADRFHLLQNLRTPLNSSSAAPRVRVSRLRRAGRSTFSNRPVLGRRARSQVGFDRVKALQSEGKTSAEIARATGFHWRTVRKWTRLEALRPRATMTPKPTTPSGFWTYLVRRWNEGCTMGKQLRAEIALSVTLAA
jgi:hypothetical protein